MENPKKPLLNPENASRVCNCQFCTSARENRLARFNELERSGAFKTQLQKDVDNISKAGDELLEQIAAALRVRRFLAFLERSSPARWIFVLSLGAGLTALVAFMIYAELVK